MKNIKQQVLKNISQKNLKPLPRFIFYLRRGVFVFLVFFTFVLAAFSLAQLLRITTEGEWSFMPVFGLGMIEQLAFLGGFVWMGLFLLFLVLVRLQWWFSRTGHREAPWKVIAEIFVLAILFAAFAYQFNIEERFEHMVARLLALPTFSEQKARLWHNPRAGMLSGVVLDVRDVNGSPALVFMDITGELWLIHTENFEPIDWEILKRVDRVGIVGSVERPRVFAGCAVRPLPYGAFWQQRLKKELAEEGFVRMRDGIFRAFSQNNTNPETNNTLLRIYKCKQQ